MFNGYTKLGMIDNTMESIILVKNKEDGYRLNGVIISLRNDKYGISVFDKEDILNDPHQFRNIEYVFSTWYMPMFTEEEIKVFFPSLKAVFYAAGTVKYFAEPFLKAGIRVFSSAKANGIPVAEFVTAQILLANKGYFQAQKANKSFLWRWAFRKAKSYTDNRKGNYGAKVGLIGCGSVGREVVRLLKPYHIEVYIHDPFISDEHCQSLGVRNVSLESLFEICDVISNHLPNIPSTQGIINYNLLTKMKEYSTFINTGRGAQVVEKDLAKVLRNRPSICALLDVCQHEPPFPWSPLLRRKNLFLSPHIAGSTGKEYDRMVEYALRAFEDYVNQHPSDLEVTLEMLDKMA